MLKSIFGNTGFLFLLSVQVWAGEIRPCYTMQPAACEVFYLTNEERIRSHLPAFEFLDRCYDMAQELSADMADRGYFDHNRPATREDRGETFAQRAERFRLSFGVGENIAKAQTPGSALSLWMNSLGHRKNILNHKFRYLAVGFKNGLFTQVFAR